MNSIKTVKKVNSSGHSYVVHLTKEIKMLGLEKGDDVIITIERAE